MSPQDIKNYEGYANDGVWLMALGLNSFLTGMGNTTEEGTKWQKMTNASNFVAGISFTGKTVSFTCLLFIHSTLQSSQYWDGISLGRLGRFQSYVPYYCLLIWIHSHNNQGPTGCLHPCNNVKRTWVEREYIHCYCSLNSSFGLFILLFGMEDLPLELTGPYK